MKHHYLSLAFAAAGTILSTTLPVSAQMMGPPMPMTLRDYAVARPGQAVKIVVRVSMVNRTTLKARVLERETDSQYRATGPSVELFFADGTPVVMGSARDVAPRAVLFVDGISTSRGKADIKKIVILTGYVKVK